MFLCQFCDKDLSVLLMTEVSGSLLSVSYLEVAQGAEAWWDLFQLVVVQVDLTDVWRTGKASVFHRLDLVKAQS